MKILPISTKPCDITNQAQDTHYLFQDQALGLTLGYSHLPLVANTSNITAVDELILVLNGQVTLTKANKDKVEVLSVNNMAVIPQGSVYSCQQSNDFYQFFIRFTSPTPKTIVEPLLLISELYRNEQSKHIDVKLSGDSFAMKTQKPVNKGHHLYQSACGNFIAGIWQSDALATKKQAFPRHEFIYIQSGSLVCIDEQEQEHCFVAGDALFIPKGTVCYWRIDQAVCTFYAVIQSVNE